jgi:FkbM family methyltransferase
MNNSPHGENDFLPVGSNEDLSQWSSHSTLPLRFAVWWARYGLRGKSWVPRRIGRWFPRHLKSYVPTKHGARLAIEPSSLDVYTHLLAHGRTWDEHVFQTCRSLLSPGQTFYDIGANVGAMSIEMANIFHDDIAVVAFEPLPALSRSIALSARLNKFQRVMVFDVMVGDREGEAELYVGSHSIHSSAIPREKRSKAIARTVTTIDRMVAAGAIPPPNVIKIDVEGGELAAFKGAEKTIRAYRPHIVFESDMNMDRFGYTRRELIELLTSFCQYQFFLIPETGGALVPISHAGTRDVEIRDLLARAAS